MKVCFILYQVVKSSQSIETVMNAHQLDALICIPNCDKITPGMLMGALRVNVPTIFVSGGPMASGVTKKEKRLVLALFLKL